MKHNLIQPIPNTKIITDLFFTSDAIGEKFEDVYLITLKRYFYDKVLEKALKKYIDTNQTSLLIDEQINTYVKEIINNKEIYVDGFVEITRQYFKNPHITVCMPIEQIDEDAIFEATRRIYEALKQLNGNSGTVIFERNVQFNIKDLPWLNLH